MAFKPIFLTPLAQEDLDNVVGYLIEKWGMQVTEKFIARFEYSRKLISANPGIYTFVNKVNRIQKCVLTKHNTIYFREEDSLIQILGVFDSRQNPLKSVIYTG